MEWMTEQQEDAEYRKAAREWDKIYEWAESKWRAWTLRESGVTKKEAHKASGILSTRSGDWIESTARRRIAAYQNKVRDAKWAEQDKRG